MDKIKKKVSKRKLRVENEVKKAKPKPKQKQVVIGARTGLEPRLSMPEPKKDKKETVSNLEQNNQLAASLDANEIEDHVRSLESISNLLNRSPANRNEHIAQGTSPFKKNRASLKNIEHGIGDEDDFQSFVKQYRQSNVSRGIYWTDRELRDLAYALQQHGFSDEDKLQAEVKTKTSNDIRAFLKSRVLERRKAKAPKFEAERHRGRPKNQWTSVSPEVLKTWPTVRKWRRVAYEQMLAYTRAKDYSRPVISALCNKFYEEEPEPADAQVIDVKLIYKYISDCMLGKVPPQLPPKESALVLDLLREAKSIPLCYDFEEERKFLKEFKGATRFKPFEVKDEFKKRLKQGPELENDHNTVSVPEKIFCELSRHKRLMQSFNPLVIPIWMLQKEQGYVKNYLEESLY